MNYSTTVLLLFFSNQFMNLGAFWRNEIINIKFELRGNKPYQGVACFITDTTLSGDYEAKVAKPETIK